MAFDPTKPVGTDSGPDVVTDTRNNLNELKTLIDARVPQSGSITATLTPTWQGQHIWDGAGQVIKRATGGDFVIYTNKTLEAGHGTAHRLRVLAADSGATIAWRPEINGVDKPTLQLAFDFTGETWKVGTSQVWHASNFNPLALAPTTAKLGRVRKKVKLLTSGTAVALAPDTDGEHYVIQLAHTATFTFSIPTGVDSDLGSHYSVSGFITVENMTGAGNVTLAATGADKIDTNGVQDGTVGNVQTLAYTITRFNPGTERHLVNFSWIS